MHINDLKEKLIAVLGYGKEGKAVTRFLLRRGIRPVLFDEKPWSVWTEQEQEEIKNLGLNFIFGEGMWEEFNGFDVAFRSPGIKSLHSKLLEQEKKGLYITSQTKWFFENCPSTIIGVTGTKGKGTTSSLIFEILKKQYSKTYLTGNIGKIQPLEIIDGLRENDFVVYELSSFQLQDLTKSPKVGVVLMVTSEHLDYHQNQQEYVQAKDAVTKFQNPEDFAIINADFANSLKIGQLGRGKKFYFSTKKNLDEGCFVAKDKICLKIGNKIYEEFPIAALQLRGEHNLQNVCAALLAGHVLGVKNEAAMEVITAFKGLEHRLEFVDEVLGVKYYNDSFSTTPETAIAAIKSFVEPKIVILGGSKKKSDFSELGTALALGQNIKALILIGEEAPRIKQEVFKKCNFKGEILEGSKSMPEIFEQIKKVSKPGDVVILSPACASFDMFTNYAQRGEQFKAEVNKQKNGK